LQFSQEALTLLQEYSWPGNVRQLKNEIERLYATHNPKMPVQATALALLSQTTAKTPLTPQLAEQLCKLVLQKGLDETLNLLESSILSQLLSKEGQSSRSLAKQLKIPRATLYNRMKKLGLLDS